MKNLINYIIGYMWVTISNVRSPRPPLFTDVVEAGDNLKRSGRKHKKALVKYKEEKDKNRWWKTKFFVAYVIMPLLYTLSVLWFLSVCMIMGLFFPYMILEEATNFGFFRLAIFGTLINLLIAAGCAGIIWCAMYIEANWELIKGDYSGQVILAALIQMILTGIIIVGFEQGWSW